MITHVVSLLRWLDSQGGPEPGILSLNPRNAAPSFPPVFLTGKRDAATYYVLF